MRFIIIFFPIFLFASKYLIIFEGNKTFNDKRLYKELGFKQTIWDKILFKKFEPKVEDKLLNSLKEELELFYKQEGFWDTKIEILKKDKKAIFKIDEKKPIIVKKIEITSNFPIKNLIPLKEKKRFSIKDFIKSKENIKNELLKNGYCSYDFDPKVYLYIKKREAYIVYFLDKKDICKIKKIDIYGNKSIKKDVILDHIYIKENENFSLEKIDNSYKRLYSLGYFRYIRFDYNRKINNNIFLDIYVKEKKKKNIYKAGIGYESIKGVHINLSWKNINLNQKQLQTSIYYSQDKKDFIIKLFIPSTNIFSKHFDMVDEITYNDEKFDYFSQRKTVLGISFLKELYDLSYKFGLFYEKDKVYNSSRCYENEDFNLIYPKITLFLDKRDSKILPTEGFFLKSDIEGGIKAISNNNYIKNLNEIGYYLPFDKLNIFLRGKVGFIEISNSNFPPGKLFFAGGANSNRAYSYNSIYAIKDGCKIGGSSIFETTVELTYPVYKNIKGAVFWDRTVLGAKKFQFFKNPINGVGVGIRYPTILGDIRVDFGFDIKKFTQNALHFGIGSSF